jgi:hypothetical protein
MRGIIAIMMKDTAMIAAAADTKHTSAIMRSMEKNAAVVGTIMAKWEWSVCLTPVAVVPGTWLG